MSGLSASSSSRQPLAPQRFALYLGRAAPNPGLLIRFEGVVETGLCHRANGANSEGLVRAMSGRVTGGEEDGIGIARTSGLGPPIRSHIGLETDWSVSHTTSFAV